jgi:hypothetical protein
VRIVEIPSILPQFRKGNALAEEEPAYNFENIESSDDEEKHQIENAELPADSKDSEDDDDDDDDKNAPVPPQNQQQQELQVDFDTIVQVIPPDPIVEVIPPEPQPEEQGKPRRKVARASYNPGYYSNTVDSIINSANSAIQEDPTTRQEAIRSDDRGLW